MVATNHNPGPRLEPIIRDGYILGHGAQMQRTREAVFPVVETEDTPRRQQVRRYIRRTIKGDRKRVIAQTGKDLLLSMRAERKARAKIVAEVREANAIRYPKPEPRSREFIHLHSAARQFAMLEKAATRTAPKAVRKSRAKKVAD